MGASVIDLIALFHLEKPVFDVATMHESHKYLQHEFDLFWTPSLISNQINERGGLKRFRQNHQVVSCRGCAVEQI